MIFNTPTSLLGLIVISLVHISQVHEMFSDMLSGTHMRNLCVLTHKWAIFHAKLAITI